MIALTLWQPWATAVALELKTIETRSWAPHPNQRLVGTGRRLAIHAAARRPGLRARFGEWSVDRRSHFDYVLVNRRTGATHPIPLGAVVCTVAVPAVLPTLPGDGDEPTEDLLGGWNVTWPPENRVACRPLDDLGDVITVGGPNPTVKRYPGQATWGDYSPGRYAWFLDDVERVDPPAPVRGGQKFWTWFEEEPRP